MDHEGHQIYNNFFDSTCFFNQNMIELVIPRPFIGKRRDGRVDKGSRL